MKSREFLESAMRLSGEIRALTSALERADAEYERVQKSSMPSHTADELFIRRNTLKAEVGSRLTRLFEIKRDIFTLVSAVPDERERLVLIMRYINNLTFEEIANDTGYEERTVYRIHKKALASVEKLL